MGNFQKKNRDQYSHVTLWAARGSAKQKEVAFPELPQSCSSILQHSQLPELLGKQTGASPHRSTGIQTPQNKYLKKSQEDLWD